MRFLFSGLCPYRHQEVRMRVEMDPFAESPEGGTKKGAPAGSDVDGELAER